MRLLISEMKKIWDPTILVILLLFGLVYYILFPQFYINYFANGANAQADFALAKEWSAKYGTTIDQTELKEILGQLEAEKDVFREELKTVPGSAELGIETYDDFMKFRNDYYDGIEAETQEKDSKTEEVLSATPYRDSLFRIQSVEAEIDYLSNLADRPLVDSLDLAEATPAELERIAELDGSEIKFGIIPVGVLDSTTGLILSVMIWIVIGVIILLSPTIVRERLNRIQGLQYSSKTGRRILSVQFAASILSALLLAAVTLLFYGGMLFFKGAFDFKDFTLMTYEYLPWVNWTYGTYLLVMAGMAVVLSVITASLTVFFSRFSKNYIGMLLKSVILLSVMIFVLAMFPIITRPFFMFNPMSIQFHTKGIEFILLGIFLVISLIPMGVSLIFERRREMIA